MRLTELNDSDLRELVAQLFEAECEQRGGHRSEVRWGGSQTAADGGLDVVVSATGEFTPTPVLPRRITGIQVKMDLPGFCGERLAHFPGLSLEGDGALEAER